MSQQEPQLDKARALDVQLVENRKQLAESQKEAALALQAKDNLHQSVCKTEKDISLLMEKQTALQTWFERYTTYSQLIPAVELITSLLTNLEMARAQSVSNRQLLDKVKKASEAEEQQLKSVQPGSRASEPTVAGRVLLLREASQCHWFVRRKRNKRRKTAGRIERRARLRSSLLAKGTGTTTEKP